MLFVLQVSLQAALLPSTVLTTFQWNKYILSKIKNIKCNNISCVQTNALYNQTNGFFTL